MSDSEGSTPEFESFDSDESFSTDHSSESGGSESEVEPPVVPVVKNPEHYVYNDRPVSYFVVKYLGLEYGYQSCLIAAVALGGWKSDNKQLVSCALALRKAKGLASVGKFRICYDVVDSTVYCLADSEEACDAIRGYIIKVETDGIAFWKVERIGLRRGSFSVFEGLEVHVHNRVALASIEIQTASKFIFRHFNLVPGDQSMVVAVKDLIHDDKMFLVTRVVRHFFADGFLLRSKIAYDFVSDVVYLLMANDADVARITAFNCRVDDNQVQFRRVLRMVCFPKNMDFYRHAYCFQHAPSDL